MNISIVIPLFNESESLNELESLIRSVMEEHNLIYEIIFIDDGSTDDSFEVIRRINQGNENVKSIRFRRDH